ncbi:MAG: type II toxin-antitoxin system death-on-curing family toxin [Acidobacteriia bacterium]|nr:type II toxin-antitoxin system death-on-curing family toxin [Terriglobia bacterium]
MKEPIWIGVLETLVLHDLGLVAFGGAAGVRDQGLLESALARPRNLLAYGKKRPSLARLAAAYAFGIMKNHPFVDGNKRTALVIAFAFLDVNGIEINASKEDAYRVFMDLARGRVSEKELGAWISDNSA